VYACIYLCVRARASMFTRNSAGGKRHRVTAGAGVVVGSLCVRARADAREQDVLARVYRIYARHVKHLTVQVERDPPLNWLLPTGGAAAAGGGGAVRLDVVVALGSGGGSEQQQQPAGVLRL
jgi:hypothetical protein